MAVSFPLYWQQALGSPAAVMRIVDGLTPEWRAVVHRAGFEFAMGAMECGETADAAMREAERVGIRG